MSGQVDHLNVLARKVYVCPEGCGWWEGNAHGHRPFAHGCRFLPIGEVVEMVPVEHVPVEQLRGAVESERARIVARIRCEADETFDMKLDQDLRDLAALIEREAVTA